MASTVPRRYAQPAAPLWSDSFPAPFRSSRVGRREGRPPPIPAALPGAVRGCARSAPSAGTPTTATSRSSSSSPGPREPRSAAVAGSSRIARAQGWLARSADCPLAPRKSICYTLVSLQVSMDSKPLRATKEFASLISERHLVAAARLLVPGRPSTDASPVKVRLRGSSLNLGHRHQ